MTSLTKKTKPKKFCFKCISEGVHQFKTNQNRQRMEKQATFHFPRCQTVQLSLLTLLAPLYIKDWDPIPSTFPPADCQIRMCIMERLEVLEYSRIFILNP